MSYSTQAVVELDFFCNKGDGFDAVKSIDHVRYQMRRVIAHVLPMAWQIQSYPFMVHFQIGQENSFYRIDHHVSIDSLSNGTCAVAQTCVQFDWFKLTLS